AGVMLGASFFHIMPEAIEYSGAANFGWWMSLGTVGLFCIERFIAPHSHELGGSGHNHWHKEHHHAGAEFPGNHEHEKNHNRGHGIAREEEHRVGAPPVAGWAAVLGLTIHTFMNGVGLAGGVQAETGLGSIGVSGWTWVLPGFTIFCAI